MALVDDDVDRLLERRPGGQRDDRDPRDHHLVETALAELDDRVDHLLLLGLEDALLPATLHDQAQLLGGDLRLVGHARAEQPGDPPRDPGEDRDQRSERPGEDVDRDRQVERDALRVGEGQGLWHELGEDDREQGEDDRDDDEREPGRRALAETRADHQLREAVGQADRGERGREEADDGQAELRDGQEPAGVIEQPADASRPGIPLLDELLHAAAADRDQGDLRGDEEALEECQQDDDDDLDHEPAPSGGGLARGSRIRAGTPTASLPAGTSRVTTAPAPVRAPAPMSRGATIIVSTPMNAPSPIVVRCLFVPS